MTGAALEQQRLAALGGASVEALAERDAVLAAEAAAGQRGGREAQLALGLAVQVDRGDAATEQLGHALAERFEARLERPFAGEALAHGAHGRVARGLAPQRLVLLRARHDRGVEPAELLCELEVGVGEHVGARACGAD